MIKLRESLSEAEVEKNKLGIVGVWRHIQSQKKRSMTLLTFQRPQRIKREWFSAATTTMKKTRVQ